MHLERFWMDRNFDGLVCKRKMSHLHTTYTYTSALLTSLTEQHKPGQQYNLVHVQLYKNRNH